MSRQRQRQRERQRQRYIQALCKFFSSCKFPRAPGLIHARFLAQFLAQSTRDYRFAIDIVFGRFWTLSALPAPLPFHAASLLDRRRHFRFDGVISGSTASFWASRSTTRRKRDNLRVPCVGLCVFCLPSLILVVWTVHKINCSPNGSSTTHHAQSCVHARLLRTLGRPISTRH